ncbi:hypothetical protein ACOMHN_022599 [Nucella lapillus]
MCRTKEVGCRLLHALTRYAWTTNFMWMFLEGFHLYRLMVHAFAVPRSLLGFYIGGFRCARSDWGGGWEGEREEYGGVNDGGK